MSRYRAAFYHLLVSLVIFAGLAWVIVFTWYPGFFYTIDGGWQGMRIVVGVQLVLGPGLTLAVFKAGKPGLKFDLTVITLLQAACLVAGMFVMHAERPLFFIFYEDHFYSASAGTFSRYGQAVPDPADYDTSSPAFVIATVPEDPIEEADFRRILYQDGLPVWIYATRFRPLSDHMAKVLENQHLTDAMAQRIGEKRLDDWIRTHGGTAEDYAFFPVHSRYADSVVAIRKSDQIFVGILEMTAAAGH